MPLPNSAVHLSGCWGWPTRPGRGRLLEERPGRVGLCLDSQQVTANVIATETLQLQSNQSLTHPRGQRSFAE